MENEDVSNREWLALIRSKHSKRSSPFSFMPPTEARRKKVRDALAPRQGAGKAP